MAGNDGLIGSQAAYDALVDRVIEGVQPFDRDLTRSDVPLPNLRQADPIQAFREALEFDTWVTETLPADGWADLIADPGGPYHLALRRYLNPLSTNWTRIEPVEEPWSLERASLATEDEIEEHPIEGLDLGGAVAVSFESRRGDYQLVDRDTGEPTEDRSGWHVCGIATVIPTDVGWQIHDLVWVEK